jgi:aminopeptidase
MTEHPYQKLAHILVDHSTGVKKGDRVAIETTTNAAVIVGDIYKLVLQRGGYPHVLLNLPEQDKLLFQYASDEQLTYTPTFQKMVTDQFEVYIRVRAEVDPRGLSDVSPQKQSLR